MMQASGTELDSGADSPTAQTGYPAVDATATGTATPDPASGSVTPAGEFADLEAALGEDPRKGAFLTRLNELSAQRRQAQEQLSQFTEVQAFLPLVRELHQYGVTPDQVVQLLQNPVQTPVPERQPPPDPTAAYEAWLEGQGIDPYALDANQYRFGQVQFQQEQRWQQVEQAREQQAVQQIEAQLTAEMQQAAQRFPSLQKPAFQRAIYGLWGTQAEAAQSAGLPLPTVAQVAEQFHGAMDAYVKGELARYAAAKQADAAVPVAAGGSAPAPVENVAANFHNLSPAEQTRVLESYTAAAMRAPG